MTTRYQLPAGVSHVSADGLAFEGDENGHIDVAGAHPLTIATLVQYAGIVPVPTPEEVAKAAADAAEKLRFEADVAAMRKGYQNSAEALAAATKAADDRAAAAAAAEAEAAAAERTMREALLASSDVQVVASAEDADDAAPAGSLTGVIPPKTRKK